MSFCETLLVCFCIDTNMPSYSTEFKWSWSLYARQFMIPLRLFMERRRVSAGVCKWPLNGGHVVRFVRLRIMRAVVGSCRHKNGNFFYNDASMLTLSHALCTIQKVVFALSRVCLGLLAFLYNRCHICRYNTRLIIYIVHSTVYMTGMTYSDTCDWWLTFARFHGAGWWLYLTTILCSKSFQPIPRKLYQPGKIQLSGFYRKQHILSKHL